METDLSFWKRSLRLHENFCQNQLPIYHTSHESFILSQHSSATFFIKWEIYIFFVHQDQFDHLKNIFLLLVSFDIWAQNGRYYQEEFPSFSRKFYLKSSRKKHIKQPIKLMQAVWNLIQLKTAKSWNSISEFTLLFFQSSNEHNSDPKYAIKRKFASFLLLF